MKLSCGPWYDRRTFELELPAYQKLGVLVSGGIDSTLLYYLLQKEKHDQNATHEIVPIVVHRKEGSKIYARPAVQLINNLFNIKNQVYRLGVTTLPEPQQVASACEQAYKILGCDAVYVGVISNRPEHTVGFDPVTIPDLENFFAPLLSLEKSHILDLYYKFGIQFLLESTHSCDISEHTHCGKCNGCRERAWAFDQVKQQDPRL